MKQKLIALAIMSTTASLSSAAFAQSNVTIYGVADATFDVISVSGGATPALKANTPNFTRVATNGSRIGFKGSEKLGNGLIALFQFESDVKFDEGGALGTARDSFVGVSGEFGKITLGNLSGISRSFAGALDVNAGADGIGSNQAILGKAGGLLAGTKLNGGGNFSAPRTSPSTTRSGGTAGLFDNRFTNAVAYVSPKFSGIQFAAQYAANENKDDSSAAKINTAAYDLGLTYDNGPIYIGLTYADARWRNQDDGNPAAAPAVTTLSERWGDDFRSHEVRLGGKYDFGNATLRLIWSQNRTEADGNTLAGRIAATNGVDLKQNVWGIGGTFNVTANGKLIGQYYLANDLSGSIGNGANSLADTGAQFINVGYEHSLSKRTLLKLIYARISNDENAGVWNGGYDFGKNGTGFGGADRTISGIQAGLRHSF
jgi:predicted porin